ncbi:hypothetical protein GOV14_01780 [Candidatus Pacearchaeota archaeon]|nr:hypothetical protein [Candidatus Pacearchaeota archaeon]
MKQNLAQMLYAKFFHKFFPEYSSKVVIAGIYEKDQSALTFADQAGYYFCKSVLNAPSPKKYKSLSEEMRNRRLKKMTQNAKKIVWAVQRMKLYGEDERIYDYARG